MDHQLKPKGVIEGFDDDLVYIELEFAKMSPSLRLDDFYIYWKDARMDCLFANRFDPRELLEMITEINKKLVSKLLSYKKGDLKSRLIALYLLLCISGQQPERLRRKVRLTYADIIELNNLCADVRRVCSHDDAQTSRDILIELDAIHVTEERLEFGPIMLEHRKLPLSRINADELAHSNTDEQNIDLDQISSTLDELQHLGEDYDYLRDFLELNEIDRNATVSIESDGTLKDYLGKAINLLRDYKT